MAVLRRRDVRPSFSVADGTLNACVLRKAKTRVCWRVASETWSKATEVSTGYCVARWFAGPAGGRNALAAARSCGVSAGTRARRAYWASTPSFPGRCVWIGRRDSGGRMRRGGRCRGGFLQTPWAVLTTQTWRI